MKNMSFGIMVQSSVGCFFWFHRDILRGHFVFTLSLHRSHLNKGCTHGTPVWNEILSTLRSQMDFCTMEMILGYQNGQDYISNVCVQTYNLHSFNWDLCNDEVKIGQQVFWHYSNSIVSRKL